YNTIMISPEGANLQVDTLEITALHSDISSYIPQLTNSSEALNCYYDANIGELIYSYSLKSASEVSLCLMSLDGKTQWIEPATIRQAGTYHDSKTLQTLSSGIYILRLMIDGKQYIRKIAVFN